MIASAIQVMAVQIDSLRLNSEPGLGDEATQAESMQSFVRPAEAGTRSSQGGTSQESGSAALTDSQRGGHNP